MLQTPSYVVIGASALRTPITSGVNIWLGQVIANGVTLLATFGSFLVMVGFKVSAHTF